MDEFSNQNLRDQPSSDEPISNSFADVEDNKYGDNCEISNGILNYIGQMLMEEDMEEQTHMLQESLDFQAQERSFYEVLGKTYPHSPPHVSARIGQHNEIPDDISSNVITGDNNYLDDCKFSGGVLKYIDQMLMEEGMDEETHMLQESLSFQAKERSFYEEIGLKYPPSPLKESAPNVQNSRPPINVLDPSWLDTFTDYDVFVRKGFEDASKFLPSGSKILDGARGKKNRHAEENDCGEERSKKLPAAFTEVNDVPTDEFDTILLCTEGERRKKFEAYRTELMNVVGSKIIKRKSGPVKKGDRIEELFDLRSLLIGCAQSIAASDHPGAYEILKQIRQHSSPFGDGEQRLAHYFANGLEARLAGTGSEMHKSLLNKRTTASDYLRAFYTSIASFPFHKISIYLSNKLIAVKSEKAMRVHVIDFGILYGFGWPTFIQSLAARKGGPPKLRITGIDFPQPGFRPAERVEETGRRLARYAETFNVPFEFNAIAQKWETIKIEDLKLEEGEFVAVNCLYRAQNLSEDAGLGESPRNLVLNLIRKINPNIFIHGIVNVSYSLPFFVSRFREALFHFMALYDMLEATVPREKTERMLIERDMFGSEALNVIACEGWERVERGETYKQWRVRHLKAGFMQVPINEQLLNNSVFMFKKYYHKEFVVNDVNKWLLMGWKGRMLYALSCWEPV